MPRRDTPEAYEAEMGRPPSRLPADHPDAWQWDYKGTRKERGELGELLGLIEEEDVPVVIEGQEELL